MRRIAMLPKYPRLGMLRPLSGFCTPGQIMSLEALLQTTPTPSDEQIMRALSGNLCCCGAYPNIVEAGRRAAGRGAVGGRQ